MRPLKILLAEDEPVIAHDLCLELEAAGHQVWPVPAIEQVEQTFTRFQPEIVILNFLQKNTADGMALAHRLCGPGSAKVLFITGARREDLQAAADYDARYRVLYKPFSRGQFWSSLKAVARVRQ